MARFEITKATAKGKTWKAIGVNPLTGRKMLIQGGQSGVKVGKDNPGSETSFDARHDATGMTPKKYINKLRWDDKAAFGTTINIPDKLFNSVTKKGASRKTKTIRKAARKASPKKTGKNPGVYALRAEHLSLYFLYFRIAHEQFPDQSRAVIFYHDSDRRLVQSHINFSAPVFVQVKCVSESIFSP